MKVHLKSIFIEPSKLHALALRNVEDLIARHGDLKPETLNEFLVVQESEEDNHLAILKLLLMGSFLNPKMVREIKSIHVAVGDRLLKCRRIKKDLNFLQYLLNMVTDPIVVGMCVIVSSLIGLVNHEQTLLSPKAYILLLSTEGLHKPFEERLKAVEV